MKCPYCNNTTSKVLDSRASEEDNSIRRRRECSNCSRRFTTYENVETTPILVIKNDGSRQPFDGNKIKMGIIKACEKRPVSLHDIELVVADIEKGIQNSLIQEIETKEIGDMVMERLKMLDEVAYIRFASVYRKFADISKFKEFLDQI